MSAWGLDCNYVFFRLLLARRNTLCSPFLCLPVWFVCHVVWIVSLPSSWYWLKPHNWTENLKREKDLNLNCWIYTFDLWESPHQGVKNVSHLKLIDFFWIKCGLVFLDINKNLMVSASNYTTRILFSVVGALVDYCIKLQRGKMFSPQKLTEQRSQTLGLSTLSTHK